MDGEITYGIKHTNGVIEAMSRFENVEAVPEGFVAITQEDYDRFLPILKANVFITYDVETNEIIINDAAQSQFYDAQRQLEIRHRLHVLSGELDLMVRLQEETGEKQAEFDALAVEYRGEPPQ